MRILAIILCSGLSMVAAQTSDQTAAPKNSTAKRSLGKTSAAKTPSTAVAQPLTIPKEAVSNADGSYSYTDKDGKKWLYNRTPFGVSRIADVGPGDTGGFTTVPKEQLIKATDNGETVKFQRQTPFGTTTWEKKKSDLTDDERHIFESQQPRSESQQAKP